MYGIPGDGELHALREYLKKLRAANPVQKALMVEPAMQLAERVFASFDARLTLLETEAQRKKP